MSELQGVLSPSDFKVGEMKVPHLKTKLVDTAVLPEIKTDLTATSILEQSQKMLASMNLLKEDQSVELVGDFAKEKTKIKIVGKGSEKATEVEFDYLNGRYRKLEKEAIESRRLEREQLEVSVAMYLGKKLTEMGIKFVTDGDDYLGKTTQVDVWKKVDGKPQIQRIATSEIVASFTDEKISFTQAIKNLKKVYGSTKVAMEKYVSQMTVGRVFEKAFQEQAQKTEAIANYVQQLESVPEEKKGVWNKLQRGVQAIKQVINKPLAPVEATVKAVTGLALYDANPLVHGKAGKFIEDLWTETPVSTNVLPKISEKLGQKFPKLKALSEAKEITMREMAARLEEKLMVDPLTGEGVRSGPITADKFREASVEGAAWAVKMNLVPQLIAELPAIKALSIKPGEIYSLLRSSRMVKSGVGSIKQLTERFREAYHSKDKGKMASIAAWGAGSAVGFYLAEKLSPVIGEVNPVLMGDIALMRLSGEVEKYTRGTGLDKTEMAETLETIEAGITTAFAADSALTIGGRLMTFAETRSLHPLEDITDEESLLAMAEDHPEYLRGEQGGVYGEIQRAEHEILQGIKGVEIEDNPWKTFSFENGTVYHVDATSDEHAPIIIKQDDDGNVFEKRGDGWLEVSSPEQDSVVADEKEEAVAIVSAVHDYAYFEPGSTKVAFRMDLVAGETWETKVDRLFSGYADGGIDDPSATPDLEGKAIQAMVDNSPELQALTGEDGVYERQVHEMLIKRLIQDAKTNGVVYDEDTVKARLVEFLKSDATADADTVEGETDYGQLYQHLFLGSEVATDIATIDTQVYQPYFLSGNEGTSHGVEVALTIPEGGTVLGELAKQGYGSGDGQIYSPTSELLPEAQIIKINSDGSESVVTDWSELNLVHPNDQFVVRTGVGETVTASQGAMPKIIELSDSKLSSWELPQTEQEAVVEREQWIHETVRNENGEIYMGVVGENSDFSHMIFGRFGELMDNPWDSLTIFQNMDVNGVSVYALTLDENGTEISRRTLNSYDDLRTLYTGETIVVDDPNKYLSFVPDLEMREIVLEKDDISSQPTTPSSNPSIAGFTSEGTLDPNNLPGEALRDKDGYIYVGQIHEGTWLSTLVSSHIPSGEGQDIWQQVSSLHTTGELEILTLSDTGEFEKVENLDLVSPGDKIVIKDSLHLLSEVKDFDEALPVAIDAPILPIEHDRSEVIDVEGIATSLEQTIANLGEDTHIGLMVIDLDNPDNTIQVGSNEQFEADKVQQIAIAMAVLRSVEMGNLKLESESRFVVLPGEYKPSLEHLLSLMLVHNDAVARDGLLKELVGQDMDKLLGEDTGLKEILSNNQTTATEAVKVYQTMLRTTYLSMESQALLQEIMRKVETREGGLLSNDLSAIPDLQVTELTDKAEWEGIVNGEKAPEYSSFAHVVTTDGRQLVVVLTADSPEAEVSRSAFRTVARELAHTLGEGSELLPENELATDVAREILYSEEAELDYMSHVLLPYRQENGDYLLDPVLKAEIKDVEELDLTTFDNQVTTYADGSGMIHLQDQTSDRLLSVFVDKNQHVSMVLDSQELVSKGIKYEVYSNSDERGEFVEGLFSPDSTQITLTVSHESSYLDFTEVSDRERFIDSVREEGRDYDFYLFASDPGSSGAVIVYGRDGERRDLGTLPENVSVAIVSSNNPLQIQSEQTQQTWNLLLDKLGTTKTINDVIWQDHGTSYSEQDASWDPANPHWFSEMRKDLTSHLNNEVLSPDSSHVVLETVVKDTFGIEMTENQDEVIVDGVTYSNAIFVPEGMVLDPAVVARSAGISSPSLVIAQTNDANVYLVGETVSEDRSADPEVIASFAHPSSELIFQYQDGSSTTLSSTYIPSVEHPLISVYPLERPLSSFVDTDRLIKMEEKEKVNLQYQGQPYFVLSDEGSRKDIYVDPYSMVSYVKSDTDFIPLVLDSYTYADMFEVYGLENTEPMDVTALWKRRTTDAMMVAGRTEGLKIASVDGKLTVYENQGSSRERVLTIEHNETGTVIVTGEGKLVLSDKSGEKWIFTQGNFVALHEQATMGMDEYLRGFDYLTNSEGDPLQYRGFPILAKGELLYIVSQEGVVLVGSKSEFKLGGLVVDTDMHQILDAWKVTSKVAMDSEPKHFTSYDSQVDKILHDLVISNDRLVEVERGVVDLQSGITYQVSEKDHELHFDLATGKIGLTNEVDKNTYIWNGEGWIQTVDSQLVSKAEYLASQGLTVVEDEFGRGDVVDRRTQSEVYLKDGWVYTLDGRGLARIGQIDSVIKAGFIGYMKDDEFQTYTPTSLSEIHGNPQYSPAERAGLLINPALNSVVGFYADFANLWADYDIQDVLPTLNRENYISYEQLPPDYISALLSQENKTLYRASDGEATNLDFGVLVKVILSGGERGGSTLVQGLIKNIMMSPDDRLERSLVRKISEVIMADQLLETMPVEEVVAMYANTVSYGSINGVEITGIGQAAQVLFGKEVKDLDLVEMGLLVAVPNYPTRNNLNISSNAVGWTDSASGVYRHMYENGFITEAEMEQAFLDVHTRLLANGSESDVEYLLANKVITESDLTWVKQAADDYLKLDFEGRKLLASTTETETTMIYADFFQYLQITYPDKFSELQVKAANDTYYWYGKVPAGEATLSRVDYLAVAGSEQTKNIGVAYTTEPYDPAKLDYAPQVVLDSEGNALVDPWVHRYEAIEKDSAGNAQNYSVVATNAEGVPLVQDDEGGLWKVTEYGLVREVGRVYQIEGGGAVQAIPANDRPGMLVDTTGSEITEGRFVRDNQGNYFRIIEGSRAEYVGQVMRSSDGRNVLFSLDSNTTFEIATQEKDFLDISVKNMLQFRDLDPALLTILTSSEMPISNDPNTGYVLPRGQGEYGLINPSGAELYLDQLGIASEAVELSANRNGKEVFEKFLSELVTEDTPVLVWLNSDLASDAVKVDLGDNAYFESISRFEKPVSVLQFFEFEGKKYVVYQDPTQVSSQIMSFDRFAELASPHSTGRYKVLVLEEYTLGSEYGEYLYDPKDQVNQVGVVMQDGHVYNLENPGEIEGMMSINPVMQAFVTEAAANLLAENGGRGVVFMAMDDQGRVPFYGALDSEGKPSSEMASSTYQPGSVYKLVTSMWALNSGVDPNASLTAGDYYQWGEGDKTYNWTMDPLTGALRYNSGAPSSMTMYEAIRQSNNPYFLGLADTTSDINSFSDYSRLVGFGDGQSFGNVPAEDSVVSDTRAGEFGFRDIAYSVIGQGPTAVSVPEMVTFISSIANNGTVVEPLLSQQTQAHAPWQLPNKPSDYEVIAEAMRQVASDPSGTAYQSFGDTSNYGYTVYGKTGTAETGDDPNAWFVGWAVDDVTGEKLSFAFLIPNGGEGSRVAAPLAREVLDKYFSDLRAHAALEADSPLPASVVYEPLSTIENFAEVEKGVIGFNVENQPNKEFIKFAVESTDVANDFVPSSSDLRSYDEATEFVAYMKTELSKRGYAETINSPEMEYALKKIVENYHSYENESDGSKQAVQCLVWEIFLAKTSEHMNGAPVAVDMSGNADSIVGLTMREGLRTGDSSQLGDGSTIVRFENNRVNIAEFEPGDAFFIRYKMSGEQSDLAHTGVILATGKSFDNQPMVLVADSNRYRNEAGEIVTDGKPRVRWLTQAQFVEQYEREGDAYAGIAPSEIVAVRQSSEHRIKSVVDATYHAEINGDVPAEPEWRMASDENGGLVLPFENSVHLLEKSLGEMKPIESIYIHWSGADSADTSTWTAEMVRNGLVGEGTSATFAVGVDAIWQLAKMEPGKVQETYATPWRDGVINIEIAGQDFDTNPPSPEQYEKVVQLITELLISANKPVSILKPHYDELYLWSTDMPKLDGTPGNWILIDSEDLSSAKYYNDATQSWESLQSLTAYTYEPTVQKKIDPGEKFFTQLQEDVKTRLVMLGRGDLLSDEVLSITEVPSSLAYVRMIDAAHPITSEEIKAEIEPYLVKVDTLGPVLAEATSQDDIELHESLMPDLTEMIIASRKDKVSLYISSGYRSFGEQLTALLLSGGDETLATPPGESQHHSGLAVDFTTEEISFVVDIDAGFENTEAGKWLLENGWKYGFVQSYTKNHDGVQNEPWHYYYLGKDLAKVWHESQLSEKPLDMFEILEQASTTER